MDNIKVNINLGGCLVNKRIISIILLFIIWLTIPSNAFANDELNIQAKSALLMDYHTGEIIYEKNSHEKVPPASISKIMTLY